MPADFSDLLKTALVGLCLGLIFSGLIIASRWMRGMPLRNRTLKAHELSTPLWIVFIGFFAAMTLLSIWRSRFSFATAFAVMTLIYVGGFIYAIRTRGRTTV